MDGRRMHKHATAWSHANDHALKPFESARYNAYRSPGRFRPEKEYCRTRSIASKQGCATLESWWHSDDARATRLNIVHPLLTATSSSADSSACRADLDKASLANGMEGKLLDATDPTFDPLSLSRRERISWLESLNLEAEKTRPSPAGAVASNRRAATAPSTMDGSRHAEGSQIIAATPRTLRSTLPWPHPAKADTSSCLAELARAVAKQNLDIQLLRRCSRTLATSSYELSLEDALRAMVLLDEGSSKVDASHHEVSKISPLESHKRNLFGETVADEMRADLYTIGASMCPTIAACDVQHSVDGLVQMAETRMGRQEFLDALLARLMMLIWQKPANFTPTMMARIMGALGLMRAEGGFHGANLSAYEGQTPSSAATNKRFFTFLNARAYELQLDFLEDDIGAVHPAYAGYYLSEEQVQKFLWRAAQLQVGMLPSSAEYLSRLQGLHGAALAKYPSLEAGLKPLAILYCQRLAAAAKGEEPLLDHRSTRYHGHVGSIGVNMTRRLEKWGCGAHASMNLKW